MTKQQWYEKFLSDIDNLKSDYTHKWIISEIWDNWLYASGARVASDGGSAKQGGARAQNAYLKNINQGGRGRWQRLPYK